MWGFDVLQMGLLRMHYWNGIDHAIAERGYPVITTQVHPSASVERRAKQLKSQILGEYADTFLLGICGGPFSRRDIRRNLFNAPS